MNETVPGTGTLINVLQKFICKMTRQRNIWITT